MPKRDTTTSQLFQGDQADLLEKSWEEHQAEISGPVECLGMKFDSDEARRAYFIEKLREKLEDPDFMNIEGFPIASEEAILELSDPPYYTACPNPFLDQIISHYNSSNNDARPEKTPFAFDVSEGRNDPVYNAHSYHTKVPPKAILRYILHYTNPGDLIIDAFAGTGMAGVAAAYANNKNVIREIGLTEIKDDHLKDKNGHIYEGYGPRYVILNDLSPAATFISRSLNHAPASRNFRKYLEKILSDVFDECGWMYETQHTDGVSVGSVNYFIWSDVIICPECSSTFIYTDAAADFEKKKIFKSYDCPSCGTALTRRELEKYMETVYDDVLNEDITRPKQEIVKINYSIDKKRYTKKPDQSDLEIVKKISESPIPYNVPTELMCFKGNDWGDLCRGYHTGTTHVHQFYTKRNLWILAAVHSRILDLPIDYRLQALAWFTSTHSRLTRLNRYMPNHGRHVGPLSGTYYLSSIPTEISPFYFMKLKLEEYSSLPSSPRERTIISTGSASRLLMSDNVIDYIFTDPPFGDNLPYSELNFLWETWLKVYTNNENEVIVSKTHDKNVYTYTHLMESCFKEYFRVLKPGRWITVEFHNSRNAVWNAIQEAMGRAGFVVSDVRTLDKKKGTTKQLSYTSGAVKQDLVISAYKPRSDLEERFRLEAGTEAGVWDFTTEHLSKLPIFVLEEGEASIIAERQSYLLFDRMVAFHVQRGTSIPLSAPEYYLGLSSRFAERDGMFFQPEQVAEYDKRRASIAVLQQLNLFIHDEASAIQWVRRELQHRPRSFQDIQPVFMRELQGWSNHEQAVELREILRQNFLHCGRQGAGPKPNPRLFIEQL